jgi:enamine deaminase RidA (YjgF/YER057c/UK114 family)
MYVTNIEQWPEVARAHQEAFGMIMPATTMVEVSQLIDPAMIVEIEADAYLQDA